MCTLGMISQERLKIEVKLLLSAIYATSIGTTDDLEWPFHASRAKNELAVALHFVFPTTS